MLGFEKDSFDEYLDSVAGFKSSYASWKEQDYSTNDEFEQEKETISPNKAKEKHQRNKKKYKDAAEAS